MVFIEQQPGSRWRSVTRLLISAAFGVALTVVVLWLMMRLVGPSSQPAAKHWTVATIDFIRRPPVTQPQPPPDRYEEPLPERREPPPEPEILPPRPAVPKLPQLSMAPLQLDGPGPELEVRGKPFLGDMQAAPVSVPGPAPDLGSEQPGGSALVLLKRIPPMYPLRARRRRIEGWVEVELRIDARGRVAEAKVLGSEPSGVFDRAALKSVRRWRFRPLGDAAPVTAVQKIEFKLE